MANTFQDLSAGDITSRALESLHNKLVFCKNINRQYDERFARSGAKNGGDLLIRNPNQFTVSEGAVMDVQDITEDYQTLTVATQRHIALNLTDYELTMSIEDAQERIIDPAMARLAAEVDKVTIENCYPAVWNMANTTHGTNPVIADVATARTALQKGLAPTENRYFMAEGNSMASIVSDGKSIFNPTVEIGKQYEEGYVGRLQGFDFYESEMVPTHTNGSRTDTTPVVNTSTGITSGTATITMSVFASGKTCTEGDVFNIADVYAVNPETKVSTGVLQKFVVTADKTATGTDIVLAVSPTPITSGAKQTVHLVSAGASKSVSFLTATDGSGAASTGYITNLAWQKDAFTLVTADLQMPRGAHMAGREVFDGISLRVWQQGDIVNDKFPMRIDVLFGSKCLRPQWACRVPGASA